MTKLHAVDPGQRNINTGPGQDTLADHHSLRSNNEMRGAPSDQRGKHKPDDQECADDTKRDPDNHVPILAGKPVRRGTRQQQR